MHRTASKDAFILITTAVKYSKVIPIIIVIIIIIIILKIIIPRLRSY